MLTLECQEQAQVGSSTEEGAYSNTTNPAEAQYEVSVDRPPRTTRASEVHGEDRRDATTERTEDIQKPFPCPECHKRYIRKHDLKLHMKYHTGEDLHPCEECMKKFHSKCVLRKHMKLHTGEKPHVCPVCSFGFLRKSTLTVHMRRHNDEKPFQCHQCPKRFIVNNELTSHVKHMHGGVKEHKCGYCSKRFFSRGDLIIHERTHTNERPFPCSECGKKFRSKSCLTRHMRLHTGEMHNRDKLQGEMHKGEMLQGEMHKGEMLKGEMQKGEMLKGEMLKGEKHQCPVCNKTFSQKCFVSVHMRIHNGKPHRFPHFLRGLLTKSDLAQQVRAQSGKEMFLCTKLTHQVRSRATGPSAKWRRNVFMHQVS